MLVPTRGKSKNFYTRGDDEQIIALASEGKSTKEIAEAISRTEASVNYRISRVLNDPSINSLDDIKYKEVAAVPIKEEVSE